MRAQAQVSEKPVSEAPPSDPSSTRPASVRSIRLRKRAIQRAGERRTQSGEHALAVSDEGAHSDGDLAPAYARELPESGAVTVASMAAIELGEEPPTTEMAVNACDALTVPAPADSSSPAPPDVLATPIITIDPAPSRLGTDDTAQYEDGQHDDASLVTDDDTSIPPIETSVVASDDDESPHTLRHASASGADGDGQEDDDAHAAFFAEGERMSMPELAPAAPNESSGLLGEDSEPDLDRASAHRASLAVERRARFVPIVTWSVGLAGLLLVAGLARSALQGPRVPALSEAKASNGEPIERRGRGADPEAAGAATTQVASEPTELTAGHAPAEGRKLPDDPERAASDERTASETKPAAAKAAEPQPRATPEAPAKAKASLGTAKRRVRALLENGKASQALPGAQSLTRGAPEDAEGWLLLGAAHQELGQLDRAKRAFSSCARQATTGAVHECRALAR